MKKYAVKMPIVGYIYKEVEANSEEEALEKLYDDGFEDEEICELYMVNEIVTGNVFHGSLNSFSIEEIEED